MALFPSLAAYRRLPAGVHRLFWGSLIQNSISGVFFLIFNLYLRKQGYSDPDIGGLVGLRYLGVLVAAVPLGIWIRGRRLQPFFVVGAALLPVLSMVLLYVVPWHMAWLNGTLMAAWGIALVFARVCNMPYVMRHVPQAQHGQALSFLYLTMALGLLLGGLGGWVLQAPGLLNWAEREVLVGFAVLGFFAPVLYFRLGEPPPVPVSENEKRLPFWAGPGYDWPRIATALFPHVLLAIGAGLVFPYMNLFFNEVFGVSSGGFSQIGFVAAVLTAWGVYIVPRVQDRYGFRVAITGSQAAAVAMLLGLTAVTFAAQAPWALAVAVGFFALRQPLMNVAAPMSHTLIMGYVGPANQEITAALHNSLWSGGWFVSGFLFKLLRAEGVPFRYLFLITAVLYVAAIVAYRRLIRLHERRN